MFAALNSGVVPPGPGRRLSCTRWVRRDGGPTNHERVTEIGDLLRRLKNVVFWFLLQFSPVGLG
jgi:hypothetical protein